MGSPSIPRIAAVVSFALVAAFWTPARAQDAAKSAAPAPIDDLEARLKSLDQEIGRHLDAGEIAEAIGPAGEKLGLLERARGKDHWQTGDARRQLEHYQDLDEMIHEIQVRYIKSCKETNRSNQLYARGQYAEAFDVGRKALLIKIEILGENHFDIATIYNNLGVILGALGRYVEAEEMHGRSLSIRLKTLPEGHPDVAQCWSNLAASLQAQGKHAEAEEMHRRALEVRIKALREDHPDIALSCHNLAVLLHQRGKFAEAEEMARRALGIWLQALPEGHPDIAKSYEILAGILQSNGKYADAEDMYRLALAIRRKSLPDGHPDIALSLNNLGALLHVQGMYARAEAMHRRALGIWLKSLPEGHPDIAMSYSNLAEAIRVQGRDAEAEEMACRALALRLKALPEGHPEIAVSYNNLAEILGDQARYAEAEQMLRQALAIRLRALPEGHPDIAQTISNIANNLRKQGKYSESEVMARRAVSLFVDALREDHPHIALSYNNLAATLNVVGKHAEAEAMYRHALALRLKTLPEDHPDIAGSYNNLAETLRERGLYAEAEAMHRHALAILIKALPQPHPQIAYSYGNLAASLEPQNRDDEAILAWSSAATILEQVRLRGTKGFDSGPRGELTLLPRLALALARAGRHREAWIRWEDGLARSLVDESIGRASRPLSKAEFDHEALLLGQAQGVDERIGKIIALGTLSQEQERLLDGLKAQGSELRRQILELERGFESKYGVLAGARFPLEAVQRALPDDGALVGWVDLGVHHFACVIRRSGDPVWVRLVGSDKDGTWTKAEQDGMGRLRAELSPETTTGHSRPLADEQARIRLLPLGEHLKGVRKLVVVNSPGLAGVPLEVLLSSLSGPPFEPMIVSYAPSASMYVHLKNKPVASDRPATLLAVADPAYPAGAVAEPPPEPPGSGIFVSGVASNGNADLNGIRPGDVLLSYGVVDLKTPADLKVVAPGGSPKRIPIRYWRDGATRDAEVAAGPLGVTLDRRPAGQVVLARRAAREILLGMRSARYDRLPGTRRETEAIAQLFPKEAVTTLMGERASESEVQQLARGGKLASFRYLLFAVHGESDPLNAYRTALILAPDPEPIADPLGMDADGRITAEQIARTWTLDADLVVLSACESGLGRPAGGEGYLGFAQPLFARGARSLVLSLWKVEDDATALLMTRFYQNLLAKRDGLKAPLPKAEALAEAKAWLRRAGPDEVGRALDTLPRGIIVRRQVVAPKEKEADRPYGDPMYWAAFVLVGSPD